MALFNQNNSFNTGTTKPAVPSASPYFKPTAPITFGNPQPNPLVKATPSTFGSTQTSTTPFVINGLKAAQPGGLSTTQNNTVKSTYIAAPKDQIATGNQENKSNTVAPAMPNPNVGYNAGVTLPANQPVGQVQQNAPQAPQQGTNPTAAGLLKTVAGFSAPDPGLSDLKSKMDALDADYASKVAGIQNSPSDLNFQTGRLAAIQSEYNSAKAALTGNYQAALQARGQNIGAAESALGTANTLQQSPYGTPLFNPATGMAISGGAPLGQGGNLDPQAQAQSLAQKVMSGQMTYEQALQSLNYAGNVGSTFLNNAITASGGSPLSLQAQGSAQQSNIATAGTAQTSAANTGYQQAVQDYGNMNAVNSAAEAQIQQVQNVLASSGLNQGIPDYNAAINSLQSRLGGTGYTNLVTAVTELQNIYSQLLTSAGTTPSGSEAQALALLNPASSAQQINAAINQLQVAAYNRLNAQYGKMSVFQNNLGSGGGSSNASSGLYNW